MPPEADTQKDQVKAEAKASPPREADSPRVLAEPDLARSEAEKDVVPEPETDLLACGAAEEASAGQGHLQSSLLVLD